MQRERGVDSPYQYPRVGEAITPKTSDGSGHRTRALCALRVSVFIGLWMSCPLQAGAQTAANAPSAQLQISVLRAQIEQDVNELRINQSVQQRSDTTEGQRAQLRVRAAELTQEIASLQARIGTLSH